MSERGLPIDGAPACPFVAFEDDRDGRSTAPDHRHRCFAEAKPAPRALAHQEAYCLSSAFPVCPAFQDWARREAAAARTSAASRPDVREEPPASNPLPPRELEPRHAPDPAPEPLVPPPAKRAPQRDWAAPPPWIAENADQAPDDGSVYGAGDLYEDIPAIDDPRYAEADDHGLYPAPDPVQPPSFLAAKTAAPADPSRGLAGSPADRLAGADPYAPRPAESYARPAGAPPPARDDLDDDWAGPGTAAIAAAATTRPASRQRYEAQRAGPGRDAPPPRREPVPRAGQPGQPDPRAKGAKPDAQELFGPAWEPARKYEAYPSLSTRIGLSRIGGAGGGGVPKLALAALALVVAALFLFLVGPMLLGFGGNDDGGAASPTPVATEEATLEPEPTLPPEPTPQVYTIKSGDTISKIARKFGVTSEELLAANPKIKNPDKIKVGQEITIPVPVQDESGEATDAVDDGTVEDSPTP